MVYGKADDAYFLPTFTSAECDGESRDDGVEDFLGRIGRVKVCWTVSEGDTVYYENVLGRGVKKETENTPEPSAEPQGCHNGPLKAHSPCSSPRSGASCHTCCYD